MRAALAVLVVALALPAQAAAQWWLPEMPSDAEVVAKVQGSDRLDTLARQHAAYDRLLAVMSKMLEDRAFDPAPRQERLLSTYRAGVTGAAGQAMAAAGSSEEREAWYRRAYEYAADDAFKAELMRIFFSRRFQNRLASIPDPPPTPPHPPIPTVEPDDTEAGERTLKLIVIVIAILCGLAAPTYIVVRVR